jgi:hypothetical protein
VIQKAITGPAKTSTRQTQVIVLIDRWKWVATRSLPLFSQSTP